MKQSIKININDYEIIDKLNEGGYGVVFSVRHKETKEKLAAKVLKKYSSDEDNQSINNEIKVLKRFHHPTIIRFYGVSNKDFYGNKNYTLFFELFENGSLEKIIDQSKKGRRHHLYTNTAKQIILIGIARGMMLLHQNRIIHHDLKPGNILIDEHFHPCITDFGISQSFQSYEPVLTISSEQGTPLYMAPEAVENENCTAKSDVYSFGVILLEVLTDSEPYSKIDRKKSYLKFMNGVANGEIRPEFPKDIYIKPSLKNLVNRCIDRYYDRRPTFEEIFSMLAYGKDPVLGDIDDDDDEDQPYFLDDVDTDAIEEYVNLVKDDNGQIESGSSKSVDELAKKVEKMDEQMRKLKGKQKNTKPDKLSKSSNDEIEDRFQQLERQLKEYQQRTDRVIDQIDIEMRTKMGKMEDRFQILTASLETVIIPDTIIHIPNEAFAACKNLKKVTIPSSVITIGSAAFAGCTELTDINIPESVVSIGKYAFNKCSSLVKIKIPKSVKKIERAVFRNCKALKDVTIDPQTVVDLGAFCGCPLMKKKFGKKK